MKPKELTFWQVRHRIETLIEYREHVVKFFNSRTRSEYGPSTPTEETHEARSAINRLQHKVVSFIRETGIPSVLIHYPAPIVGGFVKEIDLIENLYQLREHQIDPNSVLDIVERAVAVYDDEWKRSILRTFNPFFWIGKFLKWVSRWPFIVLENAGLHGNKFEETILGKVFKLATQFVALVTSILGVLKLLDKMDWVTRWLPK